MKKFLSYLLGIAIALVVLFSVFFILKLMLSMGRDISGASPTEKAIEAKLKREKIASETFSLVDPGEAPSEIRALVDLGYQIMLHTHDELPDYASDLLSCTNCHFAGGNTTGGPGAGISLAGVAAKYPTFNHSRGEVEDLPARINDCFKYSMNGKPLPLGSKPMLALVTYLHWISSKYPIYVSVPWLGLPKLKNLHEPNNENGKKIYEVRCASCHGSQGEGKNLSAIHPGQAFPPLWGPNSFNREAGMGRLSIISSFVFNNMPYDEPRLSKEEAIDVSGFVLSQPRPEGKFLNEK